MYFMPADVQTFSDCVRHIMGARSKEQLEEAMMLCWLFGVP